MATKKKKRKTNKRNVAVIVMCAVLAFILIVVLCAYLILKSYIGKINHVDGDDWNITVNTDETQTDEDGNIVVETTMSEEINSSGAENFGNGEGVEKDYVKNILLIGVDNRHFENILSNPGNSDSIILVSINSKTKKIYLTSIMRDTAAYIQYTDALKQKAEAMGKTYSDGYDKINVANARGGPEFLLDIVEGNFKVKVDDYILVDFYSLIDIIDVLGGIPMTITDAEAEAANNYIRDMDFDRHVEDWETANVLSGGGSLILNGVQAVGYARERQTSGSDFNRTSRQRAVIEQIIIKAKKMSVSQLNDLVNTLFPKVYTNMTEGAILGMVADAVTYLGYDVEQLRVPFDGMYESVSGGNLLPDYEATIEKLQSIIFATE